MKKTTLKWLALSIALAFTVSSCSDNVVSDNPNDNQNNLKPTFSKIQQEVLNNYCISCHSGSSPNGNLNLESGKAYANLVNKQNKANNAVYVKPGSSSESFLITMLTANSNFMPPSGKLSQNLIDSIKVWIDAGALNN